MPKDVQDTVRYVLRQVLEGAVGGGANGNSGRDSKRSLNGMKGLAVGAGAAALVPLAAKNAGKLARAAGMESVGELVSSPQQAVHGLTSKLGDQVTSGIGEKVEEAGGPGGIIKSTLKDAMPFGGDDGDDGGSGGNPPGVGKGRRMPVQQSVDIGVPIETVYNQWTQYEDWPRFMHRVTRVTQQDECTVSFATKVWGKTKEFTAQIEAQRPDERVKWRVSEGMTHTGVVTFHELGPRLTRVLLDMDVEPGGLLEKAARGMRHVKRAARGDLHRFKAFVEMAEQETGAWRGVIEDGEVVKKHDRSYDRNREYAEMDDVISGEHQGHSGDDGSSPAQSRGRAGRGGRQSQRKSTGGGSTRKSSGQSQSRSTRGRSRSATSASRSRASSSRGSSSGQTSRSRSRSNHSE